MGVRIKKRSLKHDSHKNETDRYVIDWMPSLNDGTVNMSVWASSFSFYFDSNHIDFCEKQENTVRAIQNENDMAFYMRHNNKNGKQYAKFKP